MHLVKGIWDETNSALNPMGEKNHRNATNVLLQTHESKAI